MTRKHFLAFEWTDESFAERIGDPEAADAAVGKIVLNFAELEFELDQSLALVGVLPVRSEATGPAAASFRAKLDRLVSLVPHLDGLVRFNTGAAPAVGVFAEFRPGCLEAAALYGQVLTGPKRTTETPGVPDPAQPLNSPPSFLRAA